MGWPQALWTLFNLVLLVAIVYMVINAYRTYVKKTELQAQRDELLINKLDELIEINKIIADHLTAGEER